MKNYTKIFLTTIFSLALALSIIYSCSKDDLNNALNSTVTVTTSSASHGCETLSDAGIEHDDINTRVWGGIEYWYTHIRPTPAFTPFNLWRTCPNVCDWMVIADTREMTDSTWFEITRNN